MGGWMEMECRKKWLKTFQFSFCKWLIHSSDYPWKINPVGSYSQQDLAYKYHYSQPHGENQLQPAATFMLSRLYKLYTGVRNCTLSKNTAQISYHPLQQHCLGVAFLFKLASQEVKQTFFQWRFKVCALNSNLLTTNFLYAFHRDLQNAGKKGKKKPTLKHSATATTQTSILGFMSLSHYLPKLSSHTFHRKGRAFSPQHIQQLHTHPAQE